jgi:hypothetical protein
MGGGSKVRRSSSREGVYNALASHPNFHYPEIPKLLDEDSDARSAVEFALEAVANYISPPKIEGENVSFTCLQLANSIRYDLKKQVLEKLGLARNK